MAIQDQLNLTGTSSLIGPNNERQGPRFLDMSAAFDGQLIETASRVASGLGFELQAGVYAGLLGPAYETPAEVRMLRTLGADAVGMSTVLEVLATWGFGCLASRAFRIWPPEGPKAP
jgi:purine-nucleoside phosphorylase